MSKASKLDAGYTPNARNHFCKNCAYFRNGVCSEVQGQINPNGSCTEYYEPKRKVEKL